MIASLVAGEAVASTRSSADRPSESRSPCSTLAIARCVNAAPLGPSAGIGHVHDDCCVVVDRFGHQRAAIARRIDDFGGIGIQPQGLCARPLKRTFERTVARQQGDACIRDDLFETHGRIGGIEQYAYAARP